MKYSNPFSRTTSYTMALVAYLSSVPAWSFQTANPYQPRSAAKISVPIHIRGHVTDASGSPLSGVTLGVKWTERTTLTNQIGEFTLENVLENDTIEVNHPGYQPYQFSGQKSIVNYFITLKPAAKTAPPPVAPSRTTPGEKMDIAGKIYDDKGSALADAILIVNGGGQGSFTNSKGEFTLTQVPINGTVVISHVSFISKPFKVQKSQTRYESTLSKDLKLLDEVVVVGYAPPDDGPRFKNSDQSTPKSPNGDFTIVEQNPEFPGGVQELYKFLGRNIRYPSAASRSRISGKAFISFTVDADGNIRNPKIIKGLGFGIDEEVLRVVLQMPAWNPARQNGKAVSKEFALPVTFNLE
jgi:TonB family protein